MSSFVSHDFKVLDMREIFLWERIHCFDHFLRRQDVKIRHFNKKAEEVIKISRKCKIEHRNVNNHLHSINHSP